MRPSDRSGLDQHDRTLSLVLPLSRGISLDGDGLAEIRRTLDALDASQAIEWVLCGGAAELTSASGVLADQGVASEQVATVRVEMDDWAERARRGLSAAVGDRMVVMGLARHYSPESLRDVLRPVDLEDVELSVAVPPRGGFARLGLSPLQAGLSLASRMVLGSSDAFSGLFALRRSLWDRGGRRLTAGGPSLVMELMVRRPSGMRDVPVTPGAGFRRHRIGPQNLRPVKHVLDARFGSFSRLIQFCCVGASGMVVDLSFYALFQWILSFTALAGARSTHFGFSWLLAVSAVMSISLALLWNFTLNRRLTFNDARGGSWIRQFITYALSNALAIALNLSLRLYLPTRIGFFARHRLAAAVVGIVAATGVSFSMSRWLVFARRPEASRAPQVVNNQAQVSQSSALA